MKLKYILLFTIWVVYLIGAVLFIKITFFGGTRDFEDSTTYQPPEDMDDGSRRQRSTSRELNPTVYISKENEYYYYSSDTRLIQMTTQDGSILSVGAQDYSGQISISVYKVDESVLTKYLTHKDGQQVNKDIDVSKYPVAGVIDIEVESGKTKSQVFPIEESGVYYIKTNYADDKVNETLVVVSNISSVVKEGDKEYIFWTQDLRSMKGVKGGSVSLYNLEESPRIIGTSYIDTKGLSRGVQNERADVAVVKSGDELCVVPISLRYLNTYYSGDVDAFPIDTPSVNYFTFVDRPIYKPGNTVYYKSILRVNNDAVYSIPFGYATVKIVYSGSGEPIYETNVPISTNGTVSGQFKLPDNIKTGIYRLSVSVPDKESDSGYRYIEEVSFQVEYFRKPEYSIEVNSEQDEVTLNDKVEFTVNGNYFSGQPLGNKKINYSIAISDLYESDYYYINGGSYDEDYRYWSSYYSEDILSNSSLTLNQFGTASVEINLSDYVINKNIKSNSFVVTINTWYGDETGNASNSSKNILVHKGNFSIYQELVPRDNYATDSFSLPIILISHDNSSLSGIDLTAKVTLERWVYNIEKGLIIGSSRLEKSEQPQITMTTGSDGRAVFSFPPLEEGAYRVLVQGIDQNGREISKEFYIGSYYAYNENSYEGELNLSVDKDSYFPSETLSLDIKSDISDRDVLLTVERGHVRRYEVVTLSGGKATVKSQVQGTDIPNIFMTVSGFSKSGFNSSMIDVPVSTDSKKLIIEVTPNKEKYDPGENVTLNVFTTDIEGNPVSANLAVWAVDKAIYEVAYNNTGNIFDEFWYKRYNGTSTSHSLMGIGGPTAEKGGGGGGGDARDTFEDTAYWNANVVTDSSGRATLNFKLPDNLTTWVISSIGSTLDTKVGDSREEIVVSKDVITRPLLPNILREGDSIVLSSLVQNFSKDGKYFDVSLDFSSGDITSDNYSKSYIGANSLSSYSWDVLPKNPGNEALLTFSAVSPDGPEYSDSIVQKIPVREYGFNQSECTVGQNETSYPIKLSENISNQKSFVQVSLASGILGSIPNSVKYLLEYPYGCLEQTTSRFVPLIIAKSNSELFSDAIKGRDVDDMIETGIEKLQKHQNEDGGWGWWHYDSSDPFISVYILEYLLEAQKLGFDIEESMIDSARTFFVNLNENSLVVENGDVKENVVTKSYAMALLGEKDKYIEIKEFENMSADILSMAIMSDYLSGYYESANAGLQKLTSNALELGDGVYWKAGKSKNFGSTDASTAYAIRAITTAGGDSEYALKAARYLVNSRKSVYWSNTFATAQVIRAIVDYVGYSEETNPDYTYVIKLDGEEIKRGYVDSHNKAIGDINISVDQILSQGSTLDITVNGEGKLYSTVCINEFIRDRNSPSVNHGLKVERQYLDGNGAEYEKMAVGDRVKVKIKVSGSDTGVLYGVIEDELPSGLIPLNRSLANNNVKIYEGSYMYNDNWDYTENGLVISADGQWLRTGSYSIEYDAVVISEGTFYVPPATASFMYQPEVYGRTESKIITVGKESKVKPIERSANNNLVKPKELTGEYSKLGFKDIFIIALPLFLLAALVIVVTQMIERKITIKQAFKYISKFIKMYYSKLLNLVRRKEQGGGSADKSK